MSQRRKILRISNNFFPMLFGRDVRHFYEISEDGLPPDARVVNCHMGGDWTTVVICLESSEFDEVAEGLPYPEITPVIRTLDLKPLSLTEAN